MANNNKFNAKDQKLTIDFLQGISNDIRGKKVIDLLGGLSRCGQILMKLFDVIDVIDLNPTFGDIPITR